MSDASTQKRLRVRYRKDGRLAYLGHLEVLNTINRSVRRSDVPFAVGNGFARRIRLQFSQALPVGASSECEFYDLTLTEELEPSRALDMLRRATPSALAPDEAGYVDRGLPALEAWLTRADWHVQLPAQGVDVSGLGESFSALKSEGVLSYLRGEKRKTIDVSSALVSWEISLMDDALHIELATRSSNDGSLRPQVLLNAAFDRLGVAGSDVPVPRVARVGQWHEGEDGLLVNAL